MEEAQPTARRTRARMAAVLLALVLAAGAVTIAMAGSGEEEAFPWPADGMLEGVLMKVDDEELTLAPFGATEDQVFEIRPVDRARFDLFHLGEHVRQQWPVRVGYETEDDGTRYVTRVDDL